MFTQCQQCLSIYRVQAEHLRAAMGMLRCTRCKNVFNALATLRDEAEIARSAARFSDVGSQLANTTVGPDGLRATPAASRSEAGAHGSLPAAEPPRRVTAATADSPVAPAAVAPEQPPAVRARARVAVTREQRTGPGPLSRLLPANLLLALRNLGRNRQRTALALGSIGFGVIALLLAGGFMEWVFWGMRESSIKGRLGHIEVTRPGFLREGAADPFAYLLPEDATLRERIAAHPGVRELAPRLTLSGLASRGEDSVAFLADAVDPARETELSTDFNIAAGTGLDPADSHGVLVGSGLARLLGVVPGDRITVLANTAAGSLNGIELEVKGLFSTANKVWNDSAMRLHIDGARELLQVDGAHLWVLLLDDTEATPRILAELADRHASASGELEFTPWYELADFYNKTVRLFSRQMNAVRLIIGLIIVLSISNVLVMGVMQRTAEIGTLMAVGLRRRTVMGLFLSEGIVLGLVGASLGTLLGWLLAEGISAIGIPLPPPPGMDKPLTGYIYVTVPLAVSTYLLALGTAVLASVYPAWKASRLQIIDALRHSR